MDPEMDLRNGFWGLKKLGHENRCQDPTNPPLSRRLVASRSETVCACQTLRPSPDKVSWDCVTVLKEIGERHHNCVS